MATMLSGPEAVQFALANAQDPTALQLPYGTELFAGELGGTRYSVAGDRVIAVTPGPSGIGAQQQIYDLSGNLLEDTSLPNYGKRSPMTDAIITAIGAAALGPGVVGLSAPTAAATASGLYNYSLTGDVEDAIKAAALAGGGTYAAQELLGLLGGPGGEQLAADLTVADDIAQLSQIPGITPQQIAETISAGYGIDVPTALESVSNVTGAAVTSAAPSTVTITSQPLAPIAPIGSVLPAATQRVDVTGQRDVTPTVIGTAAPTLLQPTQTVPVSGTRLPDAGPEVIGTVIPSLLLPSAPPTPPVLPPAPPVPPPASETVRIEAPRDVEPVFEPVFPVIPPIVPPGVPPLPPTAPPAPPGILDDLKPLLPLVPLVGGLLPTDEQKRIDNIINFPIPDYRFDGSKFVPYSNYFQIAPTDVYNYFATTAPFGAGRFGAVAQPITVPGGLLSTQ